LTDAGVDQESDGEREGGFAREIADGLRAAVLLEREIVLGEVGKHMALGVTNGGVEVDDADVGGEVLRINC
jgi:hypothetical protein